jgi:hypothetical protein
LSGDYGALIEGFFVASGSPLRTASMMHFDGKGIMSTSDFVVLDGFPLSGDWSPKSGAICKLASRASSALGPKSWGSDAVV